MDDDDVFLTSFLSKRKELEQRTPIDVLLLVVKFDVDVGQGLTATAKQFFKLFGTQTVKSLMMLCIQGNSTKIYSDDEFDLKLKDETKNPGYKQLKTLNDGKDIPYCLWDNIRPYDGQMEAFLQRIENLKKIESIQMSYVFDMVKNELDNRAEIRRQAEINKQNNQPPQKKWWFLP